MLTFCVYDRVINERGPAPKKDPGFGVRLQPRPQANPPYKHCKLGCLKLYDDAANINKLGPRDAEGLVIAAKLLHQYGRHASFLTLLQSAATIGDGSLRLLKSAVRTAIAAGEVTGAMRFLVHAENNMASEYADRILMSEYNELAAEFARHLREIKIPGWNQALASSLAIQPDEKVIGCIGPFSTDEDPGPLLVACNTLVQGGEKLKLLVVGDGHSSNENSPFDLAKMGYFGAQPWLISVSRLPHKCVADYYALLDAVVILRKSLEVTRPVPNMKAVEAIAYGKRLLVADMVSLPDCAKKHEGVVIFEAGNAESLAKAIQKSLKLPEPRLSTEPLSSPHTGPMEPIKPQAQSKTLPKPASDYKVAVIADEFTSNSFAGEFQALPLEPDNWQDIFQDHQPDVFFCESAWAGPDPVKRSWRGKVYASVNFTNENRKALLSILEYCKKAGIPTVFWNKEDPTHHNDRVHDFAVTASLFDNVFTTAAECVESYKKIYGVQNAFVLPFGTNPRLFNPIETAKRSDHVVFAGGWYENHAERCKEMKNILDRLIEGGFKIDIFDRYHGSSDFQHIWPKRYVPYLLSAKPHNEMPGVYKSSVYGLNFNTVTSSSTMFARRVFELMSSNTLVVSNYSQGVDEMFGNLVVFPDRDLERLKSLTKDEVDSIRHQALHEVLEKHTYKQRWRSILQAVGLPFVENDTTLTFAYIVKERQEAMSAISWYQQYGTQFSGSRLLLVADISVDPLNVTRLCQEFNRFGVSVTSMHHAEKYAISDRYRPVETSHFVALRPGQNGKVERIKKGVLHLQYMTEHLVALAEQPDQRHKTAPAPAGAIVLGSASLFMDWMHRQASQSLSTAYWV